MDDDPSTLPPPSLVGGRKVGVRDDRTSGGSARIVNLVSSDRICLHWSTKGTEADNPRDTPDLGRRDPLDVHVHTHALRPGSPVRDLDPVSALPDSSSRSFVAPVCCPVRVGISSSVSVVNTDCVRTVIVGTGCRVPFTCA